MTLKEQLQLLKGIDVKIGFNSSFVYCYINDENTESALIELSKEEFTHLHKYRQLLKDHIKNFEAFWSDKVSRKIKQLQTTMEAAAKKHNKKLDLRQFEKEVKILRAKLEVEKETDYNTTTRKIVSYTKRIETFTPFLDREVLEVYDSTYNDGTKIIRCEGLENGPYWFKEEYIRERVQRV